MPNDDLDLEPIDGIIEDDDDQDIDDGGEDAVSDGENGEAGADDQAEPEDLADAFARVAKMDAADPEDAMGDGGSGEGDSGEPGDRYAEKMDDAEGDDDAVDDGGYDDDRGSSEQYPAVDYQASQQAIVSQLNNSAIAQARKKFQDDGIREFTMNDIYERTQDGRVVYRNPDDPSRPFANRMEAQQWIDSFNKQVQEELIRTATEIRDKNAKAAMPALRLLQFAPTYDAMDPKVKEVFDDLIEDYEMKNRAGKVVGYSCDLNRMAQKAERLASKYTYTSHKAGSSGKVRKSGPRKSPALDARSHGSASTGKPGDGEVKTMEDAFRKLRQQMNGGN